MLWGTAWRTRNVGYTRDDGFMNAVMTSPTVMGFVASEKSLCDELGVAARHCATTNSVLVVSSNEAIEQIASLRVTAPALDVIADTRHWASHFATPAEPTETSSTLFDLDMWAASAVLRSGARRVLTPTGFVRLGDGASLAAVLIETAQANHPGLVTFIATDADALTPKHLPDFLGALEQTPDRQFAFLFAHKAKPLASYARLNGLRALLARFPGSYILGVDVPAGTDAIAHGAGWVGIGASSSRRWPRRPGDKGGGPLAAGYLPGTFLRELLEMRSPVIYADWYANSRSPMCGTCGRPLDSYRPTPSDKALIIAHNVHAIRDFALELTARPADQATWLNEQRVQALMRHTQLTSTGALVDADLTLRRLCELDDPQMRETSRTGAWL
jgi:hypothetical protein